MITVCADSSTLATTACDHVIRAARKAIGERGEFTLVLAGGSTPEKMYSLLAEPECAAALDWPRVFLFFGDERMAPPDDPRSNFGMVRRSLLERVAIGKSQIFPITTNFATATEAAAHYAAKLGRFFEIPANSTPPPCFDLVLLGLGDDGHTASLFPGMAALRVEDAWVAASPPGVLPPPVDRVTLTYPILNAGRQIVFLVAGEKKAGVLKQVLEDPPPRDVCPAAWVRPTDGDVTWLVDEAAAALLAHR